MRAFAERYTAAWCSQQPDAVAAHFTEHGTLTINGGTPAVGRAAIAASARAFMTAFPDIVVLLDDVSERDGRTVYAWTLTGTNTGPGGTGASVRISGSESWSMDASGLIADSIGVFDSADYARQLAG